MSNNKQSSIDLLENAFYKKAKSTGINHDKWEIDEEVLDNFFNQAKAMHKEEVIQAYNHSWHLRDSPYETAEKYYNEIYGDGIQ